MYAGQAAIGGALAAEPARDASVQVEMRQLHDVLEHLHEAVSSLCQRLGPIQRMTPPQPESASVGKVSIVLCPLADQIRSMRERVVIAAAILEENRNRLEI